MKLNYTVLSGICIISLLILDCIIRKSEEATPKLKRYFRLSIWAIVVVIIAEIATVYLENTDIKYRTAHIAANVAGFSVAPLIPLLIGYAINSAKKGRTILFLIPSIINSIFVVLSSWYPLVFWVDGGNVYARRAFFWVYIAAYSVSLLYLLLETLKVAKHYQNNNRAVLYVLVLFIIFGTSIQVFVPEVHASWFCVSFAMCAYYIYCSELYNQIDGVTELLNRRAYHNYLSSIEGRQSAAIIVFDIDDFKNINDEYGHPFGDYCLMTISECIKRVFAKKGQCYRIGGDEFCVISRETDDYIMQTAYRSFLKEIELMRKAEKRLPMVSVGCAYYDKEQGSVEDAVCEADKRMYHFKRNRKAYGLEYYTVLAEDNK